MSKNITLSMDMRYKKRLEILADIEYTSKNKLVRRWIDEHFEENFNKCYEKTYKELKNGKRRSE